MRLVTWNLEGLNDTAVDERTEAAVFTSIVGARLDQIHAGVKATLPPDVIVFQEVVDRTYKAHLRQHLPAGGYTVLPESAPDRQVFEVIAFRDGYHLRAYEQQPLVDSVFGRVLHVVDLEAIGAPSRTVRILTAHFDSGTEAGDVRVSQLRQVAELMASRPSVFAGDANLRKAEWLAVKDELDLVDVWESLGEPSSTRVTWQRDDFKARFDRVFVTSGMTANSMAALGTTVVPGIGTRISDHIGLLVELSIA